VSEERLIKIETLLVHQERQIQDLSDMINLQRKEIDTITRRLQKAQEKLSDLENTGGEREPDLSVAEQALRDKPPHY
jgi:uncharacterized coiled-coil protein SlyX